MRTQRQTDPAIRRAAIDRAKGTSDAALAAGAPDINLWPGHDGFDYPFQGHYAQAWEWIVDSLREIAAHNLEHGNRRFNDFSTGDVALTDCDVCFARDSLATSLRYWSILAISGYRPKQ